MTLAQHKTLFIRGGMFSPFRMTAILVLMTVLGLSHISHGQDTVPTVIQDNLISLAPKDCALFVWIDNSKSPRLVSSTTQAYGFNSLNEATQFKRMFSSDSDSLGQYSRQDFDDGKDRLYQLHLGSAVTAADVIFYDTGTWTLQNEEGWLQVESAKAVSACNPLDVVTHIKYDDLSAALIVPNWLKAPNEIQTEMSVNTVIQETVVVQNADEVTFPYVQASPVENWTNNQDVNPLPPNEMTIEVQPIDSLPAEIFDIAPPLFALQIGAFKKQEQAITHLNQLRNRLPYLDTLNYELQEKTLDNIGQVYRVRLTFIPDKASAVKLCKRLKEDNADCFVP